MNKFIIGCLIGAISMPTLAMRCNGQLVDEGDSEYDIQAKCGEANSIVDKGSRLDSEKVYVYEKEGGVKVEFHTRKGQIIDIKSDRF